MQIPHLSKGEKLKVLFRVTGEVLIMRLDNYSTNLTKCTVHNATLVANVKLVDGCNFDTNDGDSTLSVCFERNGKFAVTTALEASDVNNITYDNKSSSHIFAFNETLSLVSCIGLSAGR